MEFPSLEQQSYVHLALLDSALEFLEDAVPDTEFAGNGLEVVISKLKEGASLLRLGFIHNFAKSQENDRAGRLRTG